MNGYRRVAKLMKAVAHPIRLQVLEVLQAEGEACVCHLEGRLRQRQAYISQQLAKLREVGLVADRRDGLNIFYAITHKGIEPLIEDAKRLVVALALVEGLELKFNTIRDLPPDHCNCPRCEQKVAMASVG